MTLTALYAIHLLPIAGWTRWLLALLVLLKLFHQLAGAHVSRQLLHHDTDDRWSLLEPAQPVLEGARLVRAGYRSAWLLVLVFQTDDTRLHRLTLWRDQTSAPAFSYLHHRLAYAAKPPAICRQGIRHALGQMLQLTTLRRPQQ